MVLPGTTQAQQGAGAVTWASKLGVVAAITAAIATPLAAIGLLINAALGGYVETAERYFAGLALLVVGLQLVNSGLRVFWAHPNSRHEWWLVFWELFVTAWIALIAIYAVIWQLNGAVTFIVPAGFAGFFVWYFWLHSVSCPTSIGRTQPVEVRAWLENGSRAVAGGPSVRSSRTFRSCCGG